jgi:hypothetical protein
MANAKPGTGSACAFSARSSRPFWSFTDYDGQTRSMLETDQKLAGLDSNKKDIKQHADGSVTIWFAPKAPAGQETNWVQTISLLRHWDPG